MYTVPCNFKLCDTRYIIKFIIYLNYEVDLFQLDRIFFKIYIINLFYFVSWEVCKLS